MNPEPHQHGEDCKRIFALLSEYLDAELPAGSCDEIEKHLADCPPCIEFLESLRRAIRLCRSYAPEAQPQPMAPAARDRLRATYQKMLEARKGGA